MSRLATSLILVPTELEARLLHSEGDAHWPVAVVGFGVATAGVIALARLQERRPSIAILVGLAGTFDEQEFPVGSARWFGGAWLDGIGAGHGVSFRGPRDLGLPLGRLHDGSMTWDHLSFAEGRPDILTVAAATADEVTLAIRRSRYPTAIGEDMEAFPVAWAAAEARIPLHMVRGACNRVGNRARAEWKMVEAMAAVARELRTWDLGGAP